MELQAAQEFLKVHHRAVMVTRRRDGDLQMSPVTVGVDAEGRAIVSSRETAFKVRNLRRDPHASLCIFHDPFHGSVWIQINGTAEILSLPEAMEPLIEYYRRVQGEQQDWSVYRRRMEQQRRVLIRISIDSVGPDRKG